MNESVLRISALLSEKYYKVTHKSGLDRYICPKDVSTAFAAVAVQYGGAYCDYRVVTEGEYIHIPDGTAHFLEHKMFEREDGVDAFDYFAQTGADANAFTSFDRTCYLFSCSEKFYENLDILLSFVQSP